MYCWLENYFLALLMWDEKRCLIGIVCNHVTSSLTALDFKCIFAIPACFNVWKEPLTITIDLVMLIFFLLFFLGSWGKKSGWRKCHVGGRIECEPLALCLMPSPRGCQGKKAWLWIPHWDGLGPGGMRANLQAALLPGNSCSLHLPALHGGYLRKVCATPSFHEERLAAFVVTETRFFFLRIHKNSLPLTCPGMYLYHFFANIYFDTNEIKHLVSRLLYF